MNSPVGMESPAALLAEARSRTDAILDEWAVRLANQVPGAEGQGLAYALAGPGKRIRPALVMAGYRSVGGLDEGIAVVAAAVETVHTYSLVHDDLPCMDDADLRRGQATPHTLFGEAATARAGLALIPAASLWALRASNALGLDDHVSRKIVRELNRAAGAGNRSWPRERS